MILLIDHFLIERYIKIIGKYDIAYNLLSVSACIVGLIVLVRKLEILKS